jgi:hypothetical protein
MTFDAFLRVVDHFLLNRDHPWAAVATREPDPFRLRHDPIWESSIATPLRGILMELAGQARLTPERIESIRSDAINGTRSFTELMEQLSLSLQPSSQPP